MKTSGNTEDKPIDAQDIEEKVPSLDDVRLHKYFYNDTLLHSLVSY